ncbi:hypothetical protein PVL29_016514 [Vitis rotundifolia]|uniref:Uncharacterized protein n=1 Tax=Vitis rotundifolia TaxID=103349 RepID=A0AA38Z8X3_VITRO|nr:hypothetical protein PVL29_016514 [Vitis rotundifolia]
MEVLKRAVLMRDVHSPKIQKARVLTPVWKLRGRERQRCHLPPLQLSPPALRSTPPPPPHRRSNAAADFKLSFPPPLTSSQRSTFCGAAQRVDDDSVAGYDSEKRTTTIVLTATQLPRHDIGIARGRRGKKKGDFCKL